MVVIVQPISRVHISTGGLSPPECRPVDLVDLGNVMREEQELTSREWLVSQIVHEWLIYLTGFYCFSPPL